MINMNSHGLRMYISVLINFNNIFSLYLDMLFHFNKPSGVYVWLTLYYSRGGDYMVCKEMNPVPGDIQINLALLIQSTKKVL